MDTTPAAQLRGGRFTSLPHPALRATVVEYWGLVRDLGRMGGFTITPDCFGEMICCADDLYVLEGASRRKLPRFFLVGLLRGPIEISSGGVVRCMSARLHPWSVGRLIGAGDGTSAQGWQDCGTLIGAQAIRVLAMVERCDWPGLVEVYDRILLSIFSRRGPDVAGIDAVRRFVGEEPSSNQAVARDQCVTRRQVERRVRVLTRTSPKQLACLARFQRVRDAIWADPSTDLARLAVDAGYSDQPHMTRQFKRYSGRTPGQFILDSLARKNWLETHDVAFVQDRPGGAE